MQLLENKNSKNKLLPKKETFMLLKNPEILSLNDLFNKVKKSSRD